ncbi:MAG TPA: FUSC family protein [Caulobacteraceae bacterium]
MTGDIEVSNRTAPPWLIRHRAPLLLSLRIVVAALATFIVGHLLGLAQSTWAVLTAVIVMQGSVGGAIKAVMDRLAGSLAGAAWGVIVCLTVPHDDVAHLALALGLAIGPLAVATAFNPAWRVAPVTAIILLLTPSVQNAGPVAAAISRMLEVGVGSIVAVIVTLALAPSRATSNLGQAVASALEAMAELVGVLMRGLAGQRPPEQVEALHDRIRAAIALADAAAGEVHRERFVSLTGAFDPAPLGRTLRRVYHDLIIVQRATAAPLPEAERLEEPGSEFADRAADLLRGLADAIVHRTAPPSATAENDARARFIEAVAQLRSSGATRALPDEAVARFFGLAFALEQLGVNLDDLIERVGELAGR